jgi:hypothetical protein
MVFSVRRASRAIPSLCLLMTLLLAAGPAAAGTCDRMGGSEQLNIQLLFGRSMPGGTPVTDAAWQDFLASSVTPRFPDGLTVLDGYGQWRNAAGSITHEPSTVVLIIAPAADDLQTRLDAIRTEYRRRFQQDSVGLIVAPACASF